MSILSAVQAYLAAWNARSSAALLASLTPDGTYADPTTPGPIGGAALAAHVEGLWQAFPDLAFALRDLVDAGGGRAAFEWVMRGTNSGPFRGLPPTGRAVELSGADFVTVEAGRIGSVTGYFDGGAVPRQLGLQVVVQPQAVGPFAFGVATAASTGRPDRPAALSVTALHALDEARAETIRQQARQTITELLQEPGFVGITTATVGRRMITVAAWDDADAPGRALRRGTHAETMAPFFRGELASAGFTSVWVPHHVNPYWVRCDGCGRMVDSATGPACACGARLPVRPTWW